MKEYPIRVVSKITGLTSDQIRKWEERYPILKISRSDRGSRRFNDRDLEVLQLMVEAKKIGFTLQEIGNYNVVDLKKLLNDIGTKKNKVIYPELDQLTSSTRPFFNSCLDALEEYNLRKLEKAIYDVALELGAVYVIHKFMVPFIKHIGRLWKNNKISKSQERFANAVIRNYLENYRSSFRSESISAVSNLKYNSKAAFSPICFDKCKEEYGNPCQYFCPANVYEMVNDGEERLQINFSNCVALISSILFPLDDPIVIDEMKKIRKGLGNGFEIVINGKKSSVYSSHFDKIFSHQVYDLFSLPNTLEDIKSSIMKVS